MVERIKAALSGRKTYLVSLGLVALGVGGLLGWTELTPEQTSGAMALLAGLGGATLRAALAKIGAAQ